MGKVGEVQEVDTLAQFAANNAGIFMLSVYRIEYGPGFERSNVFGPMM